MLTMLLFNSFHCTVLIILTKQFMFCHVKSNLLGKITRHDLGLLEDKEASASSQSLSHFAHIILNLPG